MRQGDRCPSDSNDAEQILSKAMRNEFVKEKTSLVAKNTHAPFLSWQPPLEVEAQSIFTGEVARCNQQLSSQRALPFTQDHE